MFNSRRTCFPFWRSADGGCCGLKGILRGWTWWLLTAAFPGILWCCHSWTPLFLFGLMCLRAGVVHNSKGPTAVPPSRARPLRCPPLLAPPVSFQGHSSECKLRRKLAGLGRVGSTLVWWFLTLVDAPSFIQPPPLPHDIRLKNNAAMHSLVMYV